MASFLPDSLIEWGTDIVFIAAFMAAIVYVVKRVIGFLQLRKEKRNGN